MKMPIFEWDENKNKANLAKHKVSFDVRKTINELLPAKLLNRSLYRPVKIAGEVNKHTPHS